ncbi:MAG: molybdopterin synthase sulfur carrier subunit [Myxococcota bacterium]|jgi:molybdopterin synthase sulfur carrier subunit
MKIVLSGNLKRFTDFESEVELDADTILSALDQLVERFPSIKAVIYDGQHKLRGVHRLYINGEVLSASEIATRQLEPGDEVGVLTALAGG